VHPSPPSPQHLELTKTRVEALRVLIPTLLGGHTRITLEIGSGHGHFLNGYAAAFPGKFCVGIDILLDRWERSERKRTRAGLTNLGFIRADAADFFAALPASILLEEIFMLFPDPWPKRRHHKNRLIRSDVLSFLAERAAPGCRFHFRTDHTEYFAAARATVVEHPDWQLDPTAPWPFELQTVFQSRAPSYQSWIATRRARASV
jgi:tRNA (guanine-N7-)-methyltransferase